VSDELRARVERYYTDRLRENGPTHRGVDWSTAESQHTRFAQLLKVTHSPGSILDYGCGYGALLEHVTDPSSYVGYDLSKEMVAVAQQRHPCVRFTSSESELEPVDCVVASGIFNVKAGTGESEWGAYITEVLDRFDRLSSRGFAFNMLTSYSDPELKRPDLHYADPLHWFDHCKRRYARNVAVLHDYGLYEFTMIVRKDVP
jgi:SAM-dependent methyltransferase